jgi:hypothetical protein
VIGQEGDEWRKGVREGEVEGGVRDVIGGDVSGWREGVER